MDDSLIPVEQPHTPAPATPREIRLEEFFVQFVSMGAGRRYGALAKETGVPTSELIRHASKFLWRERIALIHSEVNTRTHEDLVESLADVNKRHVTKLKALQEKAFEFLDKHPLVKAQDAIKLVGMAIKMEREAYGLDKNSEQSRLQDLLEAKLEKLLDAPKPADVLAVTTEYPDPDDFDSESFPEPDADTEPDTP
jgi:hypothetical protein